jgi:hypothetical protein
MKTFLKIAVSCTKFAVKIAEKGHLNSGNGVSAKLQRLQENLFFFIQSLFNLHE